MIYGNNKIIVYHI